jgi:DNA-directed RNA polymerase III subunit RPC7
VLGADPAEIETYSDLFARPTAATPQEDGLDPKKLKMDERFFPPSLWDTYFTPEKEVKRVKLKTERE